MRIALAQINSMMGDFSGNRDKILAFTRRAEEHKCDLVVFPELALFGYSPADLLERDDVVKEQLKALSQLQKTSSKIDQIFGAVTKAEGFGKPYHNSAVHLSKKKIQLLHKQLLPSYDVFDETRFFRSGKMSDNIIKIGKYKVLVLVCEDMWGWDRSDYDNPLKRWSKQKIDFAISINASPFALGKKDRRLKMAKLTAQKIKAPILYVNMVGAQDEVIYDGGSFAVDQNGKVLCQSSYFGEDLNVVDLVDKKFKCQIRPQPKSDGEMLQKSLVLGIREFAQKNNLAKVHLGLSGGIDSAVAVCLAVDAVGPENVTAVALPGPFSAPQSLTLAKALAKNLGCEFQELPINDIYQEQLQSFEKVFGKQPFGLLHENLQARIRGGVLMMYSNYKNSLLLATSNKSELATGYSTLYGDMCGGLAPLGDLLKNQVYDIAQFYNREREVIPQNIITRAPSAELRPNQKDQDSLPPYDLLDVSVDNIVTQMKLPKTETEHWLLKKIAMSEFKRWQSAPILKVSNHAFGRGRRYPITHKVFKN